MYQTESRIDGVQELAYIRIFACACLRLSVKTEDA